MSGVFTLERFHPGHAARLVLRPQAEAALGLLAPRPELVRAYAAAGPAWTAFLEGEPVACGGVVRFWPGVGELWCWTGQGLGRRALPFARLVFGRVQALFAEREFFRVQAHVRECDGRARRFVRFLGLALEGRCPGYGPDQATHLVYGRYHAWKE